MASTTENPVKKGLTFFHMEEADVSTKKNEERVYLLRHQKTLQLPLSISEGDWDVGSFVGDLKSNRCIFVILVLCICTPNLIFIQFIRKSKCNFSVDKQSI